MDAGTAREKTQQNTIVVVKTNRVGSGIERWERPLRLCNEPFRDPSGVEGKEMCELKKTNKQTNMKHLDGRASAFLVMTNGGLNVRLLR